MDILTIGAAIVAVIEWVKTLDTTGRFSGPLVLPVALLTGAIAGYFHFLVPSVEAGVAAGFLAVGAHTTFRAAGGRS